MAEFPTEEWPGPSPEEQKQTEFVEEEMETPTFDMRGLEEKRYFEKDVLDLRVDRHPYRGCLRGILPLE
jgi:hypothetical protein